MSTLWILAANRSGAKIFEVKGAGRQIKEIHNLDNPAGRKKSRESFSDRAGRTFDRLGGGRHGVKEVDVHEHEQKLFIESIALFLQEGKNNKKYDELAFVAPAQFLGELNQYIPAQLKKILIKEVAKDLPERLSPQEHIDHLCQYLDLWNHAK